MARCGRPISPAAAGAVAGCPRPDRESAPPPSAARGHRRPGAAWSSVRRGTGRGLPPRRRGLRPSRSRSPLFPGASGVLVSPDRAGVDAEGPLHDADGIVFDDHFGEDLVPRAIRGPLPQPLMGGLPRSVPFGQVPPGHPGLGLPQDRVDHLTVIPPSATPTTGLGQQWLDPSPGSVGEFMWTNHPHQGESHRWKTARTGPRLTGTVLLAVTATRYVTPLREGGSLPGLMEADDLGTYVVKFVGAGQGRKALVAEVVVGSLAAAIGLPIPRLVTVEVDPILAANEPEEEVQDLLRASPGLNLGVDYLPGSLDLDVSAFDIDPGFAGQVLWFDALAGNVDRSWRNPNMLFWHGRPYLIDHGAALTFHHNWSGAGAAPQRSYDASEHALIGCAPDLEAAADLDVTAGRVADALALVPDEWLAGEPGFDSPT